MKHEQRILELEKTIEYALKLLTNTPPQHRREFHATARAALSKALKSSDANQLKLPERSNNND